MLNDEIENQNDGFYDKNGKFIPFGYEWGNTNPDIAHLRDTYMEAERDYFIALLGDERNRTHFLRLLQLPDDLLFEEAEKLRTKIESGNLENEEDKDKLAQLSPQERDKYHMELLDWAEGNLCLILAAIRDKAHIHELVSYSRERGR